MKSTSDYLSEWVKKEGSWPNDYTVFDTETTGFDPDSDLAVELGHCIIRNSKCVDKFSVILDWTQDKRIDQGWLKEKLISTKEDIEAHSDGHDGKTYIFDYEYLATKGLNPSYVLATYKDIFHTAADNNETLVGHNVSFDISFLENHFVKYTNGPFVFGENILDTGIIEKASQIDRQKWEGESFNRFSQRIRGIRFKGLRWSLEYCMQKYRLIEKYDIDMSLAHTAAHDCYMTHLLLEEMKILST